MSELTERLRELAHNEAYRSREPEMGAAHTIMDAADRIERLEAILSSIMDIEKLEPTGNPSDPTSWAATGKYVIAGSAHEAAIAAERERCAKIAEADRDNRLRWANEPPPRGPWTRAEIDRLEVLMKLQSDSLIAKGLRLALRCLPSRADMEWAAEARLSAPEETP